MNSQVCSLCKEVMSSDNTKQFAMDVPQIGRRLTFKICVVCQEKTKTHDLYVCLGCKSTSWYPSGNFLSNGITYHVTFRCNQCSTEKLFSAFPCGEPRV